MSEVKNKSGQVNLINPETGETIEAIDVRTRSDLISHGKGTVEDAINDIEEKVLEISKHAHYKSFDIQGSWSSSIYEMGSAHTISYDITKGSLNIESIIVTINDRKHQLSESNIDVLNETGTFTVNVEVNSNIGKDVIVDVDVYDVDGNWGNVHDKIKFRYPSYFTAICGSNDELLSAEIIKSGKKSNYDSFSESVDPGCISEEMYRMVIAVQADRTLESAKFTGVPFNIANMMNKDRVFIECSDGTTQTYNVFYTNKMTVPTECSDIWRFSLEEEE